MGMYNDDLGIQVRMSGLLATAVVEAAQAHAGEQPFDGVELVDGLIGGGSVTLTVREIEQVVYRMREHLLNDWASTRCVWSADRTPLSHWQDVARFKDDVEAFYLLLSWLCQGEPHELTWA